MKDVNIKITVDTGSADADVNRLENSVESLGDTSSSASSKVGQLEKTVKTSKGGMDSLSNSAKRAANAETQMGNAASTASTKVGKLANTTGQANNAVVELGRVASDAEYGLRGMGNNISQLATQIFQLMASETSATKAVQKNTVVTKTNAITTKTAATASKGASAAVATQTAVTAVATKTTLGFVGAMKAIGGVMMGPLGFLFLIQGAIAAITAWANSSDDSVESTDEFGESMKALTKYVNENNEAQENLNNTISSYIDRSYEMAAVTEEQKRVRDDATAALALYNEKVALTEKLEERLKTQKSNRARFEKLLTKAVRDASNAMIEYEALVKESIRLGNEKKRLQDEANAPAKGTLKYWQMQLADQKKEQTNNSDNAVEFQKYADKIKGIQKEIDSITGGKAKKGPKDTSARDKSLIDAELIRHADKAKTLEKIEVDAANRKYDKLAEDAKKYGYKTAEIEEARKLSLSEIEDKYVLLGEEKQLEADERKNELSLNQQKWEDDNLTDPYAKYLAKLETNELEIEQLETQYATEREMYKDDKDKLLELEYEYLESSQALNQEAGDIKLNRAQKLAEQELKVQEEYEEAVVELREASRDAAEGAFNLLGKLAGENKALQGIAIVGENAVAVARVITDTVATNKVLSSTATIETAKAVAAKAAGNIPGGLMHTLAASTAVKGIATNNIQAGTSIAASVGAAAKGLAALGESGSVSGGSAPPAAEANPAPSFNLVEGSEGNQIQNSIQSAGDTPVRAYVVAQDVTSQQSLDRQIESNSGV